MFKLLDVDGSRLTDTRHVVGPLIWSIGEKAGVVVDERKKKVPADGDKPAETVIVRKFASAHDLRRAFGQRWAMKVMPTVLQQLMRHEDIGTTMKFYVGQNAEAVADAVWLAAGTISGNTAKPSSAQDGEKALKTTGDDRS